MTGTLTVTAKRQITLHKDMLQHLGVRPGDQLDVELLNGSKLQLRKKRGNPVQTIFGMLGKPRRSLSIDEIDAVAAAGVGGRAMKATVDSWPHARRFDEDVLAVVADVNEAAKRYHRLLLVAGTNASTKSDVLAAASQRVGAPLVNVGLELSRRMLPLTAHERRLQAGRLLTECVAAGVPLSGGTVLLDHTEVLFDASLRQDPLRLLEDLSRNRTVVAAWHGLVKAGTLRYAAPSHPEHRDYPVENLLIVTVGMEETDP